MSTSSQNRLSKMMVEVLVQLPMGTIRLKDVVVANLGMIGYMSSSRDINAAWNQAKKKAAKEYPDKFFLDNRNAIKWNDGTEKALDKKISPANFKKLNVLADELDCNVNSLITKLIRHYKATHPK